MIKVTLNENLVPCTRDRRPEEGPTDDLTTDVVLAKKLIRIANHFFGIGPKAVFSGYRKDESNGFFTLRLWVGDEVARVFVISNLGYSGVLNAEIPHLGLMNFDILQTAALDPARQINFISA